MNFHQLSPRDIDADNPSKNDSEGLLGLIAVILAAMAFIVAFLQVILEYMSSSTVRNMCSKSAIGPSARKTRFGWSFWYWKLKVYYPLLRLDQKDLMKRFMVSENDNIQINDSIRAIRRSHDWGFRPIESNERVTWTTVADDLSVMTAGGKDSPAITIHDLNWNEKLIFLWYRLWHPFDRMQRPRASWAQMIAVFGIRDTGSLVVQKVDAESIPSTMDAPIQRIKVRELGKIAFILGFHSVKINIPMREFWAFGQFGSITTQDPASMGKVLRFEGDIVAMHALICRCRTEWVFRGSHLIVGCPSFGKYVVTAAFHPLKKIAEAISHNISSNEYDEAERIYIRANWMGYATGPVNFEAILMTRYLTQVLENISTDSDPVEKKVKTSIHPNLPSDERIVNIYSDFNDQLRDLVMKSHKQKTNLTGVFEGCAARWQTKTGSTMPTLYVAGCFMNVHGVILAYPSRALLLPFTHWVRRRAKVFANMNPSCTKISTHLARAINEGTLKFARETSQYLMSTHLGANEVGTYGWGISRMHDIFTEMPVEVQRDLIPDENAWEVNALLTHETANLLRDFDIDRWAQSILEANQTLLISFRAANCLWIQIMILDIAIQFFIRGHWGFEAMVDPREEEAQAKLYKEARTKKKIDLSKYDYNPYFNESWGRKEACVVQGIVRAWRKNGLLETPDEVELDRERNNSNYLEEEEDSQETPDWRELGLKLRDWDLGEALIAEQSIQFGEDPAARAKNCRSAMCRRLAQLLELRAIFMFAYLMLHPDSSDIYESERKERDIEMPMA